MGRAVDLYGLQYIHGRWGRTAKACETSGTSHERGVMEERGPWCLCVVVSVPLLGGGGCVGG
eukprot:scaffold58797_cov36-Tisochrysis_lutea.AAC.1